MEFSISIEELEEIASSDLKCSKKFKDFLQNKKEFEELFEDFIIDVNYFIEALKNNPDTFPEHKDKMVKFSQKTDYMLLQLLNKFNVVGNNSQIKSTLVMKLTQGLNKISTKMNDIIYLGNLVDTHTLGEIEKDIISLNEIFEKMVDVMS